MKPHILIVDDEVQNIELAKIILLKEGYQLYFADNGMDALDIIVNNPIDIVVLDLFMPKLDGFETLKKMRDTHIDIPVIVVTAYTDDESHERAMRLGANDVMTKPYDIIELKQRVKKMVFQEDEEKRYTLENVNAIINTFTQSCQKRDALTKAELITLFEDAIKIES